MWLVVAFILKFILKLCFPYDVSKMHLLLKCCVPIKKQIKVVLESSGIEGLHVFIFHILQNFLLAEAKSSSSELRPLAIEAATSLVYPLFIFIYMLILQVDAFIHFRLCIVISHVDSQQTATRIIYRQIACIVNNVKLV